MGKSIVSLDFECAHKTPVTDTISCPYLTITISLPSLIELFEYPFLAWLPRRSNQWAFQTNRVQKDNPRIKSNGSLLVFFCFAHPLMTRPRQNCCVSGLMIKTIGGQTTSACPFDVCCRGLKKTWRSRGIDVVVECKNMRKEVRTVTTNEKTNHHF